MTRAPDAGELVAQSVGQRGEQPHDLEIAAINAALLHRHVAVAELERAMTNLSGVTTE